MAVVKPFYCVRPEAKVAYRVAALPYDVYNREEAKKEALKDELSFLNIDRPETQFEDSVEIYDSIVYQKARELFEQRIAEGTYIIDQEEGYYLYELIMNGRSQTGIVACASIDDYQNNVIKKHENTREEKEQDRIRHVDSLNAQTGPIFLAYRSDPGLDEIVTKVKLQVPLYAFTSEDGIVHNVWKIAQQTLVATIESKFAKINSIYIADGHHRAASAVKVGLKKRAESKTNEGTEGFQTFLSVLFPEDQLMILPYNRVVKGLNGYLTEEFLQKVEENFTVIPRKAKQVAPKEKGSFGMYLSGEWYELFAKEPLLKLTDSVEALDVSLLQNYLLDPVLSIKDPRTDSRIDFVGGIRGLDELERRVKEDMTVAFSMYPTSIQELFAVADESKLMPPKSTWFEPKLRSGLFIHQL